MRIALGADHRGAALTRHLAETLERHGHDVTVHGVCDGTTCDYPDQAWLVGRAVVDGEADRGILACGSGIGVSIAANKIAGIRAAPVCDRGAAEVSRRHNDANVLCLSGETLAPDEADEIVRLWLETPFDGGRHSRRVDKMKAIEAGMDPRETPVETDAG